MTRGLIHLAKGSFQATETGCFFLALPGCSFSQRPPDGPEKAIFLQAVNIPLFGSDAESIINGNVLCHARATSYLAESSLFLKSFRESCQSSCLPS